MNNTQKAIIAKVRIGHVEIDGLMFPDGSYGVAILQASQFFSYSQTHAKRDFKALLGERFAITKSKTELDNRSIDILPLPVFEAIVFELAMKGNKNAQAVVRDLFGLSLHQLFCDAFNVKFEKEERAEWLKARVGGKQVRRTLTDAIKDYIATHKIPKECNLYATVSDILNIGLFGRRAKTLKEDWECKHLRDKMSPDELRWITEAEELTMRLIDKSHYSPQNAACEALKRLELPRISR